MPFYLEMSKNTTKQRDIYDTVIFRFLQIYIHILYSYIYIYMNITLNIHLYKYYNLYMPGPNTGFEFGW